MKQREEKMLLFVSWNCASLFCNLFFVIILVICICFTCGRAFDSRSVSQPGHRCTKTLGRRQVSRTCCLCHHSPCSIFGTDEICEGEMTMGMGFPIGMGISWEWDKN